MYCKAEIRNTSPFGLGHPSLGFRAGEVALGAIHGASTIELTHRIARSLGRVLAEMWNRPTSLVILTRLSGPGKALSPASRARCLARFLAGSTARHPQMIGCRAERFPFDSASRLIKKRDLLVAFLAEMRNRLPSLALVARDSRPGKTLSPPSLEARPKLALIESRDLWSVFPSIPHLGP